MVLSPIGVKFRQLALEQVGKRYIFGYEVDLSDPNPKAFDCSELVQWLYAQCGYRVPDGSYNQYPRTVPVAKGAPLHVGDPYFFKRADGKVYHVGVYVGNGECVEARGKAYGVIKTNVPAVKQRGGEFRRFVADMTGKSVVFEVGIEEGAYYWVLAHANGYKANKLVEQAKAMSVAVAFKMTDRQSYKTIEEQVKKLG